MARKAKGSRKQSPKKKQAPRKTPAASGRPRRRATQSVSQNVRVNVVQSGGAGGEAAPPFIPFEKGYSSFSPITIDYGFGARPMEPMAIPQNTGVPLGLSTEGHTLGGSAERSRLVREAETQTPTPIMADANTQTRKRETRDMGTDPDPVMSMARDDVRERLRELGLPTRGTANELRKDVKGL